MTWTLGQHNVGQSNTASTSVASGTFATGATTTTLVVGFVDFSDENTGIDNLTSITDNVSGNTYNLGNSGLSTVNGSWVKGFWLYGPQNSPTIFTANFSSNRTFKSIFTVFFTNTVAGTITLDGNPTVNTGSSTTPTTNSVTPAVSGELYVAACATDSGLVPTAGGSATLLDTDSSAPALDFGGDEYQANVSVATALSFSISASSTWAAAVLTFKPPAAGSVWGFEEEQHQHRRRVSWRLRSQLEEFINNPTQFPAPPWIQDPDYFPRRRQSWRAHPQPLYEEFLNNPTQFPAPPWIQDPDPPPRRRVSWRAHPQPLYEEFLNNPTQFPAPPWVQDPDTFPMRRVSWRSRVLDPNEFINNPTQFPAPPWVQDPDPPPRHRVSWRAYPQPDDTSGFPFTIPPTVYVEWGDELRGRQILRVPWRSKTLNPDEFLNNPTQFPAPSWIQDPDYFPQRPKPWRAHPQPDDLIIIPPSGNWQDIEQYIGPRRRPWWSHLQLDDLIIIPVAAVLTPANWGDIEQYIGPKQRPRWHRLTLVVDEWYPFILPPPPPPPTPISLTYEFQYGVLVSAYNTGQLTVQQFYYALYKLQWAFSGAVDWATSFTAPPSARPTTPPGDPPAIPIVPFPPTQIITNQADRVVDAGTLVATARALLSCGCPPKAFPAPYPPRWAFQFYGGR